MTYQGGYRPFLSHKAAAAIQSLTILIMTYFDGLQVRVVQSVPRCEARLDREFPDYCAFNFARSGRIFYARNEDELTILNAPLVWWTMPGFRYRYGALQGQNWEHFFVTFSGPRLENFIGSGLLPRQGPHWKNVGDGAPFVVAFTRLLDAQTRGDLAAPRAVLELESLLLLAHETPVLPVFSPLETALRAWGQSLAQAEVAPDIGAKARELCVSDVHLRRVFTRVNGAPPAQFWLKTRLGRAAQKLRETDEPIKSIAAQTHFADIATFSRHFRRAYGLPPATYRRESRGLVG